MRSLILAVATTCWLLACGGEPTPSAPTSGAADADGGAATATTAAQTPPPAAK